MSDHSSHSSTEPTEHSASELSHHIIFNAKIFAALLGLTFITIAFQFIHFGTAKLGTWAQILLVLIKVGCAAGFVTFLLHRSKMLTNILMFTGFFLIMLIALTVWGSLWGAPIPGTLPVR
jgi:membrane-bound ClpP family serine protease